MDKVFQQGESTNPFSVISPENLTAEEVDRLFVEVLPDFNQLENTGHAMVMGSRGTGKSMMFRSLLPDVQMKRRKVRFSELPFLAFHIPIKNAQLHLTDLVRLDESHAAALINEHFLVLNFLIVVLKQMRSLVGVSPDVAESDLKTFVDEGFIEGLIACGCDNIPDMSLNGIKDLLADMHRYAIGLYADFMRFVLRTRPGMESKDIHYDLPLLSYQMFLIPFLRGLRLLPGFPHCEVYLLIDDADNLSKTQTMVLNTWLSSRTAQQVSLKVASQLGRYKTFYNVNGLFVEAPHDYLEINISERYSKDFKKYSDRVAEIVEKRLLGCGMGICAREYFPVCEEQEATIQKILEKIKKEGSCDGRPCRENDAPRYARAVYIRGLANVRYTYRYAGFDQLVWLSSGVVRYFLDAAATMYDCVSREGADATGVVKSIPFAIQDRIVRTRADDRMYLQFAKLSIEDPNSGVPEMVRRLQNLVTSIGQTFSQKLVSTDSARRFSAIALTNMPTAEIARVLDFGLENGYFLVSSIGDKSGSRRTKLYTLNKSLFPHFNLDPIGDYGYLFVTNESLWDAILFAHPLRDAAEEGFVEQLELFGKDIEYANREC